MKIFLPKKFKSAPENISTQNIKSALNENYPAKATEDIQQKGSDKIWICFIISNFVKILRNLFLKAGLGEEDSIVKHRGIYCISGGFCLIGKAFNETVPKSKSIIKTEII
jgi:hypothetical protein